MRESVGLRGWSHLRAAHNAGTSTFGQRYRGFFLSCSEKPSWILTVTPGDVSDFIMNSRG